MTVSLTEPPDYLDEVPWDMTEPPQYESGVSSTGTPYSIDNAEFSNRAHQHARMALYPEIFGVPFENLEFESTLLDNGERGAVLDGEMAIDRIVKVTALSERLHQPITFTVQERFRKPQFESFQDVTFTEWNNRSNLPSELYKLTANIFLYGYFDEDFDEENQRHRRPPFFTDAIAIEIPITLIGVCNNELPFTIGHNPRSDQSFVALKFLDLWKYGVVLYWMKNPLHPSPAARPARPAAG